MLALLGHWLHRLHNLHFWRTAEGKLAVEDQKGLLVQRLIIPRNGQKILVNLFGGVEVNRSLNVTTFILIVESGINNLQLVILTSVLAVQDIDHSLACDAF